MRRILKCLTIMAMFSGPLQAEEGSVQSRVYIEQSQGDSRTVSDAATLRKGDRIVTILDWDAHSPGATMTSAIPDHLSFLNASVDEVEVSTDGGRNWRQLADSTGGQVTHLRWRSLSGRGRLAYSAIVR